MGSGQGFILPISRVRRVSLKDIARQVGSPIYRFHSLQLIVEEKLLAPELRFAFFQKGFHAFVVVVAICSYNLFTSFGL